MLMERYKVTGDQALRLLVKVSNDNNLALRSVAENLASTGLWMGAADPPKVPERSPRAPDTNGVAEPVAEH